MLAEDVERLGPGGAKGTERTREALRVLRVRTEVPPGQRTPMTQVTFPSCRLSRSYSLDGVVLVGNNTLVSEGSTRGGGRRSRVLGPRTAPLLHEPVTWLRDPSRAGGRRPRCPLLGGRAWHPVDSLLDAAPDELAFSVESLPAGAARLRFGEGDHGSELPLGAEVRVRYRVGRGQGATGPRCG